MNEKKSSPEKSASNEITAASRTTFHYYSATTGKNIRKYKSSIRKNKKSKSKNRQQHYHLRYH
jgi:hypothetical protein